MRARTFFIAVGIVGILMLVGVGLAWQIDLSPQSEEAATTTQTIREVALGAPSDSAPGYRADVSVYQPSSYTTATPLALHITPARGVTQPIQVSVRAITSTGTIQQLSPAQLTFAPGMSTYCCWKIPEPGKYTFQIFRPGNVITSLPLTIGRGPSVTPTKN